MLFMRATKKALRREPVFFCPQGRLRHEAQAPTQLATQPAKDEHSSVLLNLSDLNHAAASECALPHCK
jgi:hypothetical protein